MAARRAYTPARFAKGRYRFEETDEPESSIAADFKVTLRTFRKYVRLFGWKRRHERPPVAPPPMPSTLADAPAATPPVPPSAPTDDLAALAERLRRAVEQELAAVEEMRARLGSEPQEPAEAERTARTLATLARTLTEIERLRFGASAGRAPASADDDDVPEDIDEFRLALARKIDALLESRADAGGAARVDAAPDGEA